MKFFFILNLMIIMIFIFFIFMNLLFMKKKLINPEKSSPFECGFNLMNYSNIPFSIQFYYISILFLIFDIEISLILPMIQKLFSNIILNWMITFILILIILILGLFYEWNKNLIKWFY